MGGEIGVIFHLGLYSYYGFDDVGSASRRKIKNGSEWYLKRLMVKDGDFRPTSGYRETQKFHEDNFGDGDYFEIGMSKFSLEDLDLDSWMELIVSIGGSYAIITTKHHDGFCLWPTKTTDNNINNTPFLGNDFLKLFIESARKHNLEVGFYYSWMEFLERPSKEYLNNIVIPQMDELIEYNVDRWFFDGNWEFNTKIADKTFSNIIDKIYLKNPNSKINDRIAGSKESKKLYENPNYLGKSTYRTYSDREIPQLTPNIPWEHINTIGLSWGINFEQTEKDFKTPEQLANLYNEVKNKNGNFLINLGPSSNGNLDEIEVNILSQFSNLI